MNSGQIQVVYNNYYFSPVPLVSQSYQPIKLNSEVWGEINSITLQGYFTGITGINDYINIANIFSGNFGTLQVWDSTGITPMYNWQQVVVEDINVDQSIYPKNGFLNYNIKLKSYNVPSGVIDMVSEYSFKQNEDGTADLSHKCSAQGVRTQNPPLTNAIAYVGLLTGNSLSSVFIPYGSPVLLSINEIIDRVTSKYEVNLSYRFMTGLNQNFTQVSTLNINQSTDQDYTTLDYICKYNISPITGNLSGLLSYINSNNYLNEISNTYGINSPNIYQTAFSIDQNIQANTVDIKSSYISGLGNDISGYFDYVVTLEKDLVAQRNVWGLEGQYITKGPLNFRKNNVNYFKNLIGSYQPYLCSLINNSPLSYQYGNPNVNQTNQILNFKTYENTGMSILKLSISTRDLDPSYNLINPTFSIDYVPPLWQYSFIPSATTEGLYITQDLQALANSKFSFSVKANSSGNSSNFANLQTLFNTISGQYVYTGFQVKSAVESGILEETMNSEWLMQDILSGTQFQNNKIYGSISSSYFRPGGYQWGF